MNELLSIEVVYATTDDIHQVFLDVQDGSSLNDVVILSGFIDKFELYKSPINEVVEILGDFLVEPLDEAAINSQDNNKPVSADAVENRLLHPLYKLGVYGELLPLDTKVKSKDRVEVYRPLTIDPKEARFHRVKLKQKKEQKWGHL